MDRSPPEFATEDLVSVAQIGDALDMGESTVWLFVKRHSLPRYRVPARGKTTLFRWGDVAEAYHRPVAVEPGTRQADNAKKAVA